MCEKCAKIEDIRRGPNQHVQSLHSVHDINDVPWSVRIFFWDPSLGDFSKRFLCYALHGEAGLRNIRSQSPPELIRSDILMLTGLMAQGDPCQFSQRVSQSEGEGTTACLGWPTDSLADICGKTHTTDEHYHKCQQVKMNH